MGGGARTPWGMREAFAGPGMERRKGVDSSLPGFKMGRGGANAGPGRRFGLPPAWLHIWGWMRPASFL